MRGHSSLTEKYQILDSVLPNYRKLSDAPSRLPSGVRYDVDHPAGLSEADQGWLEAERKRLYKAIDELGRVWLVPNPVAWPRAVETVYGSKFPGAVVLRPPPRKLALSAEQARAQASLAVGRVAADGDDGFGDSW